MKKLLIIPLLAAVALLNLTPSLAENEGKTEKGSLEAIEFLAGYSWGWGKLRSDDYYETFPLMVAFDFDLRPLTRKINIDPPSLLQFQIEPFISTVASPQANVEFGIGFSLKVGLLPQTSKLQPYIKGGAGLDYMTLHTREQSTQFNFIEYAGIGAHYFFKKNLAFTVEGRIRHLSNAGIEEPNHGFNAYFALAGIAYQF